MESGAPRPDARRRRAIAFVRSAGDPVPLPATDDDIAFAPVTQLSRWIEQKALTSERLTNIYLRGSSSSIRSFARSSR